MCESTICNGNALDNVDKIQLLTARKDDRSSKYKKKLVVFSDLISAAINGVMFWSLVCASCVIKQINSCIIF